MGTRSFASLLLQSRRRRGDGVDAYVPRAGELPFPFAAASCRRKQLHRQPRAAPPPPSSAIGLPGPETTKPRCRGASQAAAGLTADDGVERTLPATIEGTTTESPWRWAGAPNGARRPRVPCLRNPPRHQAPENDDDQVSLRLCRI